ncbi:MAG: glycosyltransferase family 2 protein [Verrucomicrobiaceae bacterium]|nr:glycosyltransferase family 2 protein [Verrucomicrobiaceae bacterium]
MTTPTATIESPRIAVIIPAYNEAITIREVITRFHSALPDATYVVVDNRSSDDTGTIARLALRDCGASGMVLYEGRPGKANAVRLAFHEVQADVYVMIDADMTYHPEDLPAMLAPVLEKRADLVIGDRQSTGHYLQENKRPMHVFGNRLVINLVNRLFGSDLKDIMSGYRVMTHRFVEHTPILRGGFELETESTIFALSNRFRIVEVPIRYTDRPAGSASKLNTVRDGIRVCMTIFGILMNYRPLFFFGILSAACAALGLALGMLPVMEYIEYRYVYRVPTAILAMGLMVLSVLFSGIALILSNVNNHFMALFEVSMLGRRPKEARPPMSRRVRIDSKPAALVRPGKVEAPSYIAP